MKTLSVDMATHVDGDVTTLATCWQVVRKDGAVFTFTDHDRPLVIDIADGNGPLTYKAESSYNRSAIKTDDTLAVDNLDLTGVLKSGDIEELDLRRGLFNHATIRIFLVNWANLSHGIIRMRKGWLGEVTITPNGFFQTELRGLTQALSRKIGELISPECRADLGDPRCKVPVSPNVVNRRVTYAVGDYVLAASEFEGFRVPQVLVRGDGNASDLGYLGLAPTVGSQANFSLTVKKFGTHSIEFSPSGSVNPSSAFVSYPDHADLALGAGQFTIEGWVRFKDLTDTLQTFASQYLNTGDQRGWYIARSSGDLRFAYSLNGIAVTNVDRPFAWAINTWYHFAVTRDGAGDIRLFIDGVQLGAVANQPAALFNSTEVLRLGKIRSAGTDDNPLFGFIDDFRITVGKALYTAGFTPLTEPFETQAEWYARLVADTTFSLYDNRIYRCTTAGTTGNEQPAYDTDVGDTTADGTAVFTAEEAWSRAIEVTVVDGTSPRKKFTVTELTPDSGGVTPGRDYFPTGSMNGGLVIWETGDNAGKAMEIRDFTGGAMSQDLELFLAMPFDIQVGDKARVHRGCFKRVMEDCKTIFENVVNFRGEPYLPGQDLLLSYPDAKG